MHYLVLLGCLESVVSVFVAFEDLDNVKTLELSLGLPNCDGMYTSGSGFMSSGFSDNWSKLSSNVSSDFLVLFDSDVTNSL